MKKFLIVSGLVALIIIAFGQKVVALKQITVEATGKDVTETVATSRVEKISTSQSIIVNYTVGKTTSVTFTAPESLVKHLDIKCKDGKLVCRYREGVNVNLNGRKVVVSVTAPAVSEYKASSSAQIKVTSKKVLKLNDLETEASSSAKIDLPMIEALKAEIEAGSSGEITVQNLKANMTDIEASSSGSVSLGGDMRRIVVEASSGANVIVTAKSGDINVKSSSGASVDLSKSVATSGALSASSGSSIIVNPTIKNKFAIETSSGGSIH